MMFVNYIPWSGYEPFIRLCNAQTVIISTHLHVAIMHTPEQEKKERLIKWLNRFDSFTTIVRRSLIQMHRGTSLDSSDTDNVERAFIKLKSKIEADKNDKLYIEQYRPELDNIMNIFRSAVSN